VKEFLAEQKRAKQAHKAWQANELVRQREDFLFEQRKRYASSAKWQMISGISSELHV
jgi:hypothetical protein